jgi:hypothetical protein
MRNESTTSKVEEEDWQVVRVTDLMKFLANLNAKYQVVCKLYLLRYLA